MIAIVLVGGFGTRLQSVVPDLPKPMAPILDKPFLAYLIQYLQQQGIKEVIFALHYLPEKISQYFTSVYNGMKIRYITEDQPLGTGGAIVNALSLVTKDEPVFVLNGDTFVKLDYQAMYAQHQQTQACFTMGLRSVTDCARYGSVITQDHHVVEFAEKGCHGPGFINAGVYLLQPNVFAPYQLPTQFSIETDFLFPHIKRLLPYAFCTDDYFIDIGIPDDYQRACKELPLICAQA